MLPDEILSPKQLQSHENQTPSKGKNNVFVHICKHQLEDPPNFLNLHQLSKNKLSKNQLSHEIGPFNNPIGQKNWSPFLQPSKLLQQRFDEETQLLCLGKTSGRPRLQDAVGEVVSMWSATPKITTKKKKMTQRQGDPRWSTFSLSVHFHHWIRKIWNLNAIFSDLKKILKFVEPQPPSAH